MRRSCDEVNAVPGLLRAINRPSRVFAALMLAGACSLIALNVIQVLHHVDGHICPAEASGDPFDCFICNALQRFSSEPAVEIAVPAPQPGEVLAMAVLPALAPDFAPYPASARAPPTSTS